MRLSRARQLPLAALTPIFLAKPAQKRMSDNDAAPNTLASAS